MNNVNSSPERDTFQEEAYLERCKEAGKDPSEEYLELFKSIRQHKEELIVDPKWQQNNLEYDLRSTKWICDKAKASDSYAQNLYAAMCNMQFVKNDVWPLLKDQRWSASWRSAGGIVADMLEKGDYMDWYCSGIHGDITEEQIASALEQGMDIAKYVGEGHMTEEIKEDLFKLGWIAKEWEDDGV